MSLAPSQARPRREVRRVIVRWCIFLGIVYLGCLLVLWTFENSLVFRPLTAAESWNETASLARNVWLAKLFIPTIT